MKHLTTDVCIIGAGAAGLVLARSLESKGVDFLVVESGGTDRSRESDALNTGSNVGTHAFEMGGRRRLVGGGLNDWGGNCAFLEAEDFAAPLGEPGPAWPLHRNELARFEADARDVLGIANDFERSARKYYTGDIREKIYLRSDRKAKAFLSWIGENRRIVANHTFLRFITSNETTVESGVFSDLDRSELSVTAKIFVICCGADNPAQLMRALPGARPATHRWPALGKFLHAHLLIGHGFLVPRAGFDPMAYGLSGVQGGELRSRKGSMQGLQVASETRKRHDLLNGAMFLAPLLKSSVLVHRTTRRRARRLGLNSKSGALRWIVGFKPDSAVTDCLVQHFIEQPPRAESHVRLGRPKGPMAQEEAIVNWTIGEAERHTVVENCRLLGEFVEAHGIGRLIAHAHEDIFENRDFSRNMHPMGGTIMGLRPDSSVVDPDCKMHGMANLYVLGGSVIPRIGAAMVTGVIIQLALRLAEHLVKRRPG